MTTTNSASRPTDGTAARLVADGDVPAARIRKPKKPEAAPVVEAEAEVAPIGDAYIEAKKKVAPASPLSARALMAKATQIVQTWPRRFAGTHENYEAAKAFADMFGDLGLKPLSKKPHAFLHGFDVPGGRAGNNIIGVLEGTDPALKDEYVIVSAHHDLQQGTPGANDNTSGIVGVLALAEMFKKNPPARSVMFVLFDWEEQGRVGSFTFERTPPLPLEQAALMVNMDMIGQVHHEAGPRREFYSWSTGEPVTQEIVAHARGELSGHTHIEGYPRMFEMAQHRTTDAQGAYYAGVPVLNLLSGRDVLNHQGGDGIDRLIPERLEDYVRFAHIGALHAANYPTPLSRADTRLRAAAPLMMFRSEATQFPDNAMAFLARAQSREKSELAKEIASELLVKIATGAYAKETGFDLLAIAKGRPLMSEVVLNDVRVRHKELAAALRTTRADDARTPLRAEIKACSIAEQVLSAGVFYARFHPQSGGSMHGLQAARALEAGRRLLDLRLAAYRLKMPDLVEQALPASEVGLFRAMVTPEQADAVGRAALNVQGMGTLGSVVSQATRALLEPINPAQFTADPGSFRSIRRIEPADVNGVRAQLNGLVQEPSPLAIQLRREVAALRQVGQVLPAVAAALTDIDVKGVKATQKDDAMTMRALQTWGELRGQLNAIAPLVRRSMPKGDFDKLLGAFNTVTKESYVPGAEDVDAAKPALFALLNGLVSFFAPKAQEISSFTATKALAGDATVIHGAMKPQLDVAEGALRAELDARAGEHAPVIAALEQKAAIYEAAVRLGELFNDGGLRQAASLQQVEVALGKLDGALATLENAAEVRGELGWWREYLASFEALEPAVAGQRKKPQAAVDVLMNTVLPKVQAELKDAFNGFGIVSFRDDDPSDATIRASAERVFRALDRAVGALHPFNGPQARPMTERDLVDLQTLSRLSRTWISTALQAELNAALAKLAESTQPVTVVMAQDFKGTKFGPMRVRSVSQGGER